jgi:hypothetical protein
MHAPHAPEALHLEDTHAADGLAALVTGAAAVVAVVAVALGAHRLGMAFGAVGVLTGLAGQMVSRTRPERFLDVIGLVACGVAFAVGAALGGLSFNG